MNNMLRFASVSEAATGLLLIVDPQLVVRLLFGMELGGSGGILGRMLGITLVAIGVAGWPARSSAQAILGWLVYAVLAAVYMTVVGLGGNAGILLWPAVLLHAVLTVLLASAWLKQRKTPAA
jgi:hypothetical protein